MENRKWALFFFAMAVLIAILQLTYSPQNVFDVIVHYDGKSLSLVQTDVLPGEGPDHRNQPDSGFTLKVISYNDNILYSFKFNIELEAIGSPPRPEFDAQGNQITSPNDTIPVLTERDYDLMFPYFDDAKTVEIYDENNTLVLTVDVSKYTEKQGFNVTYAIAGLLFFIGLYFWTKRKKK